jgi:hypothetical protein
MLAEPGFYDQSIELFILKRFELILLRLFQLSHFSSSSFWLVLRYLANIPISDW